jgi:ketopantoate reductase
MDGVATPENMESLEGQFQVRCSELITETRALGFNPNVWVSMINGIGAIETARKLLADHHVLVATPWLVDRGRPELTIEHEIGQTRWRGLFTDEDRNEAENRLAAASATPT